MNLFIFLSGLISSLLFFSLSGYYQCDHNKAVSYKKILPFYQLTTQVEHLSHENDEDEAQNRRLLNHFVLESFNQQLM
jgi:hypothetical protein